MPERNKRGRISTRDAALAFLGRCIATLAVALWLVAPIAGAAASVAPGSERMATVARSHDGHDAGKARHTANHHVGITDNDGACSQSGPAKDMACLQMCLSHCSLAVAAPLLLPGSIMHIRLKFAGDERGCSVPSEPSVPPPRFLS